MALAELLLQSLLMAAGTFAIGMLPLTFAKSRSNSNTSGISIFSVGLLVSTSLAVIIPEGVAVVLRSTQNGKEGEGEGEVHEHLGDSDDIGPWIGAALCAGFLLMFCIHQYAADHPHGVPPNYAGSPRDIENGSASRIRPPNSADFLQDDGLHESGANGSGFSSQPGDYFSVASSTSSKTITMRDRRSLEGVVVDPLNSASPAFSTFIGLLFHALADGISLGAASAFSSSTSSAHHGSDKGQTDSGDDGLSLIIFLSLIIHKAPVAFSLSSLLMSFYPAAMQRAQKSHIRRALGVFSLATPIGAVVTWLLLRIVALISWSESVRDDAAEEDGNVGTPLNASMQGRLVFWTGMALLFSAGTFLFVSTHVMAEMESPVSKGSGLASSGHSHQLREDLLEQTIDSPPLKGSTRIALFVVGMLTPFCLSMLMGHHH